MADNSIPKTSGIYKITCTANGKIYVGSSVNLRRRWNEHQNRLKNKCHNNRYLQNAWNKYGENEFMFEVIELTPPLTAFEREQYWLDMLMSYDENIGFNISKFTDAPMLGQKASPETCIKIGLAHKGKIVSKETRDKLSVANKGRKHSIETRMKVSAAGMGRKQSIESIQKRIITMQGYTHSLETRTKISIANKGKTSGRILSSETKHKISIANCKPYIVIDPSGNEMSILGLQEFCKNNNLDVSKMVKVAKGTRNHHKGWKCRYG